MISALAGLAVLCVFPGFLLYRRFVSEKESFLEAASLTVLLSAGINFFLLFAIGLLGQINLFSVLTAEALLLIALLFARLADFPKIPSICALKFPPAQKTELLLYAAISVILFLQSLNTAFFPFFAWDSIASYNTWAKQIYGTGSIPMGYPPFTQTAYAFIYIFSSPAAENFAHLLSVLFLLVSLVYSARLAKELGGFGAIPATLLASAPLFLIVSNSGYSDIFASAFLVSSVYYLIKSCSDENRLDFAFLSGLLGGLSASTKLYSPYLFVALPVSFILFALQGSRNKKRASQLLALSLALMIFGTPWLARNFAVGNDYVQRTFFSHSGDSGTAALWGEERASNYANRVIWAAGSFFKDIPLQTSIPAGIGVLYLIYLIFAKRGPFGAFALVALVFLPLWALFFSYELRHLLLIYPLLLVSFSVFFKQASDWLSKRKLLMQFEKSVILLLLFAALAPAFYDVLNTSLRGTTIGAEYPSQSYLFSHVLDSDEEKRVAVFGEFYKIVLFIRENESIRNSAILTTEPRVIGYLEKVNFSKTSPDYVIYSDGAPFWDWNRPSWAGTEIEGDLRGNRSRFFTSIYSTGAYHLLKVNKGVVETYLSDKNA